MITRWQYGDDGYDDIHALWVSESSPSTFDEIGLTGGRIYKAINYANEANPQFVLVAADGPTELSTSDDLEETGIEEKPGYERTMPKHGTLRMHRDVRGKLAITYDARPLEDN